ncbi:unnamed protein product [Cylicostephanus goldi]|uniref:Uncharacterized protein n=1 Tax=Cylicostephanus goldi TaxID=71465 RepID=A0A3P6S7P6_CYLGO|nr:unnamed protein product [Cylicostephanus goldi]
MDVLEMRHPLHGSTLSAIMSLHETKFKAVYVSTILDQDRNGSVQETVEQPGHSANAVTVRQRLNEEIGEDNAQEIATTSFQQREMNQATPIFTPISQMHIAQRTRARIAARRSSGAERNRVRRSQETPEARHQRLAEMRERYCRRRRQPHSEERGEEDLMQEMHSAQRSRAVIAATITSAAVDNRLRHGQEAPETEEELLAATHVSYLIVANITSKDAFRRLEHSTQHANAATIRQRRSEEIGESTHYNATIASQQREFDEPTLTAIPILQMRKTQARIAARRSSAAERDRLSRIRETPEARVNRLATMRERNRDHRQRPSPNAVPEVPPVNEHHLGEMNVTCIHCGAAFFSAEIPHSRDMINTCCNFGNIVLEDKFADFPADA